MLSILIRFFLILILIAIAFFIHVIASYLLMALPKEVFIVLLFVTLIIIGFFVFFLRVSKLLERYVIARLAWCFIMVPILIIFWFPYWVALFWLSYSFHSFFCRGNLQAYQALGFQREYIGIAYAIFFCLLGPAVITFLFRLLSF